MQSADSRALRYLEGILGEAVPPVARFDCRHFGYREEEGRLVALELQGRDLTGLPESLGELVGRGARIRR